MILWSPVCLADPPMAEMSPVRRRMVEDMTVRNLSPATQRSYVRAVAKSGRFFGHPQQAHVMGAVPT